MKPKHIIRALNKFADANTKEQTYYALEKAYKPFVDEDGQLKTGFVVEHKVNHGRRVKKVFKKYGLKAALLYLEVFKKVKAENEENLSSISPSIGN